MPISCTRRIICAELVARAERGGYDLVSLMVRLHCRTAWERLLIPAFVFFFFKLYPPRRVADPARRTAAAAGGCMLIRRETIDRIGGVDTIRDEIIDDCALARRVKAVGRVWLAAAESTVSIREYGSWRAIWDMIARCAFAQLGYATPALVGTVAGMALIYLAPPLLLLSGPASAQVLGAAAWAGMSVAFVPVLRLYRFRLRSRRCCRWPRCSTPPRRSDRRFSTGAAAAGTGRAASRRLRCAEAPEGSMSRVSYVSRTILPA